jgi:hypothetical protein
VQRVQALLAVGGAREREEARRELEGGIEIVDVREGEVVFAELWAQVSDDPLPAHYDTRLA